jgi:HK97 family phage portal protein
MPSPSDYQRRFGAGGSSTPISLVTAGTDVFSAFSGAPSIAGLPPVNEQSAQTISAINACVQLLSGGPAAMPVDVFANTSAGEKQKLHDDPLWWILNREFTPRWAASAGWDFLMRSRLFHGDGFAEIIREGRSGAIVGLRPHHPLRVHPAPWKDASRLAYAIYPEPWEENQDMRVLDQDDVLHVTGWGFDGIRSVSPLRHALRMTGGVTLAAQDYSGQFFANQARPDYVLATDQSLSEEQVSHLRSQIDEKHARARGQAFRPMVLQGGLKIETVSLTNEDAELVATRSFQIEEIARVFMIPPVMIGHAQKTSNFGTGVAEQGSNFVKWTLRPHLNAFQNEINRKFFRGPKKAVEFDTFELERGEMKSMFEAFRIAMGRAGEPGFMTRDEVRAKLYMNKTVGGDQFSEGTPNAQPAV